MKIDKMILHLTKDEIEVIAQTFSTYRFENNEEGLYYKCKGEKGKIAFITGYVQMGLLSGWIHTLERTPGYISISIPQDKTSFIGIMKFLIGIVKGMGLCGAIIWGLNFLKSGKSIDTLLKRAGCVHIRMLVIKKEYQHKGYMRKFVQLAFNKAEKLNVPCVVCTDSIEKAEKYQHLGFRLFRKRILSKHSIEYDMIWFPKSYCIQ